MREEGKRRVEREKEEKGGKERGNPQHKGNHE